MTNPKTVPALSPSDGVPIGVHRQPLDKTQELPALDVPAAEAEPDAARTEAVPREVVDGEVTVPVRSSINSMLTFEVLRLQSIDGDDDDGTP
jgi:hypothetical protein